MVRCTEPVDLESVNAGLDSLGHNPPVNQIVIEFISIENPKITGIGENVQAASAVIEHSAHPYPPIAAIPIHRNHLVPQNSKTFRT